MVQFMEAAKRAIATVCSRKDCPWPRIFFVSLALASSHVSSTPPLVINLVLSNGFKTGRNVSRMAFKWLFVSEK